MIREDDPSKECVECGQLMLFTPDDEDDLCDDCRLGKGAHREDNPWESAFGKGD